MSSISISASHLSRPRTRLRLTTRGRRVLAFAASLPAIIALCAAVLAGGAALASSGTGADSAGLSTVPAFSTVTVHTGDTLWSIASAVAPGADPRDVVDAITRLNALSGAAITPGQELAIPNEYAP